MINIKEFSHWQSVYQQPSFNNAIREMGLPNSEMTTPDSQIIYFFSWEPDDVKQFAWEVSPDIDVKQLALQGDRIVLHFMQSGNINDIQWDGVGPDFYSTPIIRKNVGPTYTKRFKRSLQKVSPNLKHSQAETDQQINQAIKFLNASEYPERRDHFDPHFFQALVFTLLSNSVAELHVVYDQNQSDLLLGSAVILKSPNQVNFRWYSNNHASGIGHFFMQSMIENFLAREEISIVNLSGMPHPNEQSSDPLLRGIAEFKKQITEDIIVFEASPRV